MGRDRISFASIKIQNLDCEPRAFDDSVHECLETDFINLRLDSFDPGSTVRVERHGEECLISVGI